MAVEREQRDPVARAQAESGEAASQPCHPGGDQIPGEAPLAVNQPDLASTKLGGAAERLRQSDAHAGSLLFAGIHAKDAVCRPSAPPVMTATFPSCSTIFSSPGVRLHASLYLPKPSPRSQEKSMTGPSPAGAPFRHAGARLVAACGRNDTSGRALPASTWTVQRAWEPAG